MKSILEELFYGNVCPHIDCRSSDKETRELMGYVANHHDRSSELHHALDTQMKRRKF